MALAEQLESRKDTGPLGRDDFVKRRQEARAAADDGRTDAPGDGDEISSAATEAESEAGEQAVSTEAATAALEDAADDPFKGIFDPDELGVEEEPAKLPVLKPPASMTATEKASFDEWPDDAKQFAARMHESQARSARESGETTAARNKEIEDRTAELDRSLVEAKAVLDVEVDDIPFTPIHSDEKLAGILEGDGSEEYLKAVRENDAARADHQAALADMKAERAKQKAEIDKQIGERTKQIVAKFREDLPKLIPAWAKPEVAKKEAAELSEYLGSNGFSETELKQVADARLVALSRKAMKYDKALAAARERRSGKGNGGTLRPAPVSGRQTKPSGNADLKAAEQRYDKHPTADNFASLRKLKREAAEANTRRRA